MSASKKITTSKAAKKLRDLAPRKNPKAGTTSTVSNPNVMKKIDSTQETLVQNLKG